MSRRENRKEFKATGIYDVRRMPEASNYSAGKLEDARQWIYEQDHRYERRADIKSTWALILAFGAFVISALRLSEANEPELVGPGEAYLDELLSELSENLGLLRPKGK
jgi:hypothetical protein